MTFDKLIVVALDYFVSLLAGILCTLKSTLIKGDMFFYYIPTKLFSIFVVSSFESITFIDLFTIK